jgi:hypothetical protein
VQFARPDIELQHGMIPCTLNPGDFTEWLLLSAVNIAMAYREDIDQWSDERKASRTILNLSLPDDPIVTKYMEERKASSILVSNKRHSIATPEDLARLWNIGIQKAKETVRVTTKKSIRTAIHPMTRRVRVDHLHLHQQRLRGTWYTDTLLSKVKSKLGNTCANVYTRGSSLGWCR